MDLGVHKGITHSGSAHKRLSLKTGRTMFQSPGHPAEVKSTRMSKMGMREAREKHTQTLSSNAWRGCCANGQRQPQLRTASPEGQDLSFPKGHLQSQTKTQRGCRAGHHFRAHGWVRGESDKGSLGDNLQNVYYKIQYRLAKCFPMFSNTYTAG